MGRGGGIEDYFRSNLHDGANDGIKGRREPEQLDQEDRRTANEGQGDKEKGQGNENDERERYADDEEMVEESTEPKRWGTDDWPDEDEDKELRALQAGANGVGGAEEAEEMETENQYGKGQRDGQPYGGDDSEDSEGTTKWWTETNRTWEEKRQNRTNQNADNTVNIDDEITEDRASGTQDVQMQSAVEVTPGRDKRKQEAIKSTQKVSPINKSPRREDRQQISDEDETEDETPPEIQNKSRDADAIMGGDTPPKTNVAPNPYRNKENKGDSGMHFIQAVTGQGNQTRIRTHEKVREKYESVFEVSFDVSSNFPRNPTERDEAEVMTMKLDAIGKRAKLVDRKAKINPCLDTIDAPTLRRAHDIPARHHELARYLKHMYSDRRIRAGRNSGWKVRITTSVPSDEFLHYWELTKREYTRAEYITLKKAPLQTEKYHIAGYMLNSSDGQLTDALEKALQEELGCKIGLQHVSAPLDKRTSDEFWKNAKKVATDRQGNFDRQKFFRYAPFALGVFAETRNLALQAADKLHTKYGKSKEDLQYARLPDGARMRFIPASVYLDFAGKVKAGELFNQQVHFQNNATLAPIPIRDPNKRFEAHGNRTMQELVLDLICKEKDDEPYFRHLTRKFYRNYKTQEYMVSIHTSMYTHAAAVLRKLKQTLTETYSAEVGDALLDGRGTEPEEHSYQGGTSSFSGISLDASDRYMNGPGRFVIEGMERVGKTLAQVRAHGEDARTLQLNSTTSGRTGETGQTIPDPPGDGDTETVISGRTTIPSIGQVSMVTDTSGITTQGWQLKGDSVAEERMRKIVMEAQARTDVSEGTKDAGGHGGMQRTPEDTSGAKDKLPEIPTGGDGETCRI